MQTCQSQTRHKDQPQRAPPVEQKPLLVFRTEHWSENYYVVDTFTDQVLVFVQRLRKWQKSPLTPDAMPALLSTDKEKYYMPVPMAQKAHPKSLWLELRNRVSTDANARRVVGYMQGAVWPVEYNPYKKVVSFGNVYNHFLNGVALDRATAEWPQLLDCEVMPLVLATMGPGEHTCSAVTLRHLVQDDDIRSQLESILNTFNKAEVAEVDELLQGSGPLPFSFMAAGTVHEAKGTYVRTVFADRKLHVDVRMHDGVEVRLEYKAWRLHASKALSLSQPDLPYAAEVQRRRALLQQLATMSLAAATREEEDEVVVYPGGAGAVGVVEGVVEGGGEGGGL